MRRCSTSLSIFLLAVFGLGGLISPVAHRVVHVHDVEHRHGKAAAHFSPSGATAGCADFLVEEQTPPDELSCELCARLSLAAFESHDAAAHLLAYASTVPPNERLWNGRNAGFSRIRAPPMMS